MEALGNLACYRMAVAAMANGDDCGQGGLTVKVMSEVPAESSDADESSREKQNSSGSAKLISDAPAARINDARCTAQYYHRGTSFGRFGIYLRKIFTAAVMSNQLAPPPT